MCGIVGWSCNSYPPDREALERMMRSIAHRGPDDSGTFFDDASGIALGHNRLSIIDLSTAGHQPMVNAETGDVLVFNGEIYNFHDLRDQLAARGVRFRSRSDTEVLLAAIACWGMDCLSRLEGMYAFAVWRPCEQMLYLVRDPLGIKPLYYWQMPGGGGLFFASELKAFLAAPTFAPRPDPHVLQQFLEFGYAFDGNGTSLAGVNRLSPGHLLAVSPGGAVTLRRFFTPDLTLDTEKSERELEAELHETLCTVMHEHLVADVPVGVLLSGGLDSSILAALARRSGPVTTITMGFAHSDLDERSEASRVARHIDSDHHELLITPEDVRAELADERYVFDDLFADWGTLSTRLLYRKCRERGIRVVIVGEGSDELFGGYDVFRRGSSRQLLDWWLFQLYRNYAGRRYGQFFGRFRAVMREHLETTGGDRFAAIRLFETQQQLPNNYVMKVDKASMSVSVEARVPYLDRRIARIAYRIPGTRLLRNGTEKHVLRSMATRFGLLPAETVRRPKLGGSMAMSWMDDHGSWRAYAREVVLERHGWAEPLGLRPAMEAYFEQNRTGYGFPHAISIFRNLAWRLLILQLWSRAYRVAPSAV